MAKILIVDDEPDVRVVAERALKTVGHDVVTAYDGYAALALLRDRPFDLMLTDIAMPGMDGITLALQVGQDYPHIKILMMTGYAHERQRAHNLEELINEVITKPFDLATLIARIDALLAG